MLAKKSCSWCGGTGRRNRGSMCPDCDGEGYVYMEMVDGSTITQSQYNDMEDDDE